MTRASNAPYEPQHHPDLPEPWRSLLVQFLKFCEAMLIDSKEEGVTHLVLKPTQRYLVEEIFWGLSEGLHDFVILKARQLGISTVLWALDLFWMLRFPGMQGMYIADDEPNKEIHRSYLTNMYESLPPRLSRGPWRANNRLQSLWSDQKDWRSSRLQWAFANKRNEGQLARSRGINYVHGTEMDSWRDKEGVAALTASLSDQHPYRLYLWEGTGQGYQLLYEMWEQAGKSVTSRQVFIGFWRNPAYTIRREDKALWAAYGAARPTPEELEWGAEVRKRYGVTVTREQLCWWRWKLAEGKGINGDQVTMLGEYPWLPEHAFQSSGSGFVDPQTRLGLRLALRHAPPAQYFRYDWGERFDSRDDPLIEVPEEAATLIVWEPPVSGGVYVVGGDPAYGSSPDADRYASGVWRCFPDALVQVAEYCTELGAMYQFAWVLAHLAGLYRVNGEDHLILEIGGPGRAVDEELQRMANYGFGMTRGSDSIQNVLGGIQRFLYRRVDSISGQMAWHFNTTTENRKQIFEQLKDSVQRKALIVRSPELVEEIAALEREKETGYIFAGGVAHDDRAFAAALAVHCWLQNVIPEIEDAVAPLTPPANQPAHVGESVLRNFLGNLRQSEPTEETPMVYGVRTRGPGR